MKPKMNYRTCIIGYTGSILILVFILLGVRACGQSIALDINVHSNGTLQYGLAVHDITHCTGIYYNRIVKECYNADHYLHRGVTDISGYSAGIIVTTIYERIDYVSIGFGELYKEYSNTKNADVIKTPFLELRSGIILKDWITLTFGISSYPTVLTGIRLKLNLQ